MERNCIRSVMPFSALGQRGRSEALTKRFVNPRNDGGVEMRALGGKCTAIVVTLLLSKRAAQGPAAEGGGFAAVFG